jgi:lipoyl(octanoyl) transferase
MQQQLGEFEKLDVSPARLEHQRLVRLYDFSRYDPIPYHEMWEIQKEILSDQLERLSVEFQKETPESQYLSNAQPFQNLHPSIENYHGFVKKDTFGKGRDSIIMLQHTPVYTLGTGSDTKFVKNYGTDGGEVSPSGIDVVRIERGGEVTYHGPGQLVAYPILDLREYKKDIHWYIRALEEAILKALTKIGISDAKREENVTGVWVNNKKIAALGVKVKRWVTMHGLAINVSRQSIDNFSGIVPCGLEGREVCCINDFLEDPISVEEFSIHLADALEEVFEIKLII